MLQIHGTTRRTPHIHVLHDFADQAAQMVADAIVTTIREKGQCRLGLAGGSTPAPVYARLRALLPERAYRHLRVTWTDERACDVASDVPGDWQAFDPATNLHAAYDNWLAHVPLPPEQVLPLAFSADVKQELRIFGQRFKDGFRGELDVALLGTGQDGHVASLFPGHPALDVDDIALAIHDSPKPPSARISLTLPVLQRARTLVVLATGKAKAEVLARAAAGDPSLPLGRLAGHPRGYWLLDRAAAGVLLAEALGAPSAEA